jgi:hypothetical protein
MSSRHDSEAAYQGHSHAIKQVAVIEILGWLRDREVLQVLDNVGPADVVANRPPWGELV